MPNDLHYTGLIKQAKEAEQEDDVYTAAELYEKAIKQKPVLEQPYNRLMIIYRKQKEYSKELKVIEKALDVFTGVYDKKKKPYSGSSRVARLSKAILKSVNPKERNMESNYPEPIPKWLTRKEVVKKKIKAGK